MNMEHEVTNKYEARIVPDSNHETSRLNKRLERKAHYQRVNLSHQRELAPNEAEI